MKHYKSVEFFQFLECQSPRTNANTPFWKLSSEDSESAVYSQEDLTQMKQELKYLRAQWYE